MAGGPRRKANGITDIVQADPKQTGIVRIPAAHDFTVTIERVIGFASQRTHKTGSKYRCRRQSAVAFSNCCRRPEV